MRNLSVHDDGQDRFEKEKEQFHNRVREGYLAIARQNKKRFKVIDATRSVDEVEMDISNHMMSFIHKNKGHN
jgi:dTMP kinase